MRRRHWRRSPASPRTAKLAASLADPFMFQDYYGDRAPEALAKEFGPQFAMAVEKLEAGLVAGSGRVRLRMASGIRRYCGPRAHPGVRRDRARGEDRMARRAESAGVGEGVREMRAKYIVLLPAPPDSQPGSASAAPLDKSAPPAAGNGNAVTRPMSNHSAPPGRVEGQGGRLKPGPAWRSESARAPGSSRVCCSSCCCQPPAHAHESRPAYLEIKETAPGQFSVLWRTPVLAGMRLPVVLKLPDDVEESARSPCVRNWRTRSSNAGGSMPGQTDWRASASSSPGCSSPSPTCWSRFEMLDGRKWTTIVHPSQPWVEMAASQTWLET